MKTGLGASATGKTGRALRLGRASRHSAASSARRVQQTLPGTRTVHLSTPGKAKWELDFEQYGRLDEDGFPIVEAVLHARHSADLQGGQELREDLQHGGLRPAPRHESRSSTARATRSTATCRCSPTATSHVGWSRYSSVTTTLYRNGAKVGTNSDPLDGAEGFKVPAGDADVQADDLGQAERQGRRGLHPHRRKLDLPLQEGRPRGQAARSAIRFDAADGLDSRVPADKKVVVPVTVQGAAAGSNLKSLAVYVSYDYGQTWKKAHRQERQDHREEPGEGRRASPSTPRSPTRRATSRRSRSTTRTTGSRP